MLKAQLFVHFLIFYVQKSYSYQMNLVDIAASTVNALKILQQINTAQSSGARISDLIRMPRVRKLMEKPFADLSLERKILNHDIQDYRDLIDWDEQCNAQWRTSPTKRSDSTFVPGWRDLGWNYPASPQESDRLVSSSECLDGKMDAFRETIHRAFRELINKAIVENKGCIGISAVSEVHHLYAWAVKFETDAALKRAAARADRSSVNNVAQPSTPDYSIEFKNQYHNYTQILIDFFESVQPRFSLECNNETINQLEDVSGIELTGFLKKTIFTYDNDQCGSIWWSCNSISKPKYTEQCKTTWLTKGAVPPYDYQSCYYLEAIDTCLTDDGEKYRYVDSTKLGFKGQRKSCSISNDKQIGVSKSGTFRACYCESMNHVWKIHVGMIESDVEHNFAIVGVSFQVVGNTLALRVAEGRLRSLGYATDFRWIPLKDMESNSVQLTRENAHFFLTRLCVGLYFRALTSIQFALTTKRSVSGFELKAYGHSFDYDTVILSTPKSEGYIQFGCKSPDEIQFPLVRPPSDFIPESSPKDESCAYIKLKQSSDDDDFGQSTLPLFHSSSGSKTMQFINIVDLRWRGSDDNSGVISLSSKEGIILYPFDDYVRSFKQYGHI